MAAQASDGRLLAGAAEGAATPPAEGTFLIGPMEPGTGVKDDLFARAPVLSDGDRSLASSVAAGAA